MAKSLSPKPATRPSRLGAPSSGEAEGEGTGDVEAGEAEAAGLGAALAAGAGRLAVTVATAPSEMGPFLSLPSSICTGGFRVRSVSAQEAGEVRTMSCANTPSTVPLPACMLRASWKAVITRKPRVISWVG